MLAVIKKTAYFVNAIVRLIPNFLTDPFPPSMMGKVYLKKSRSNPFGIKANRTNQAVCAKYCGDCPSNPFTNGGLYCISGKSEKEVAKMGCNCFECELFDQCGGGQGYFCKYGSAAEVNSISIDSISLADSTSKNTGFGNQYDDEFVKILIKNDELKNTKPTTTGTDAKDEREVIIQYEGENFTIKGSSNKTILENSLANNIPHTNACGGKAKCSTCRILVTENLDAFGKRNEKEEKMAKQKFFPSNIRLACQSKPQKNVTIRRLVVDEKQTEEAIGEGKLFPGPFGLDETVTVLFSDIRSFTTFSETALPYDIVHILNDYFQAVCEPIDKQMGYVDKYIGDGIMAIFGIGGSDDGGSSAALAAGFEMLENLKSFNEEFQKKYNHQFQIGIGLHSGEAVLAKIGFKKKRQFTAIGDTVNTASRIESSTKKVGTPLLVSETVHENIKDKVVWGKKFVTELKGKKDHLKLYEPLSFTDSYLQEINEKKKD